jgi:hypothetical protein
MLIQVVVALVAAGGVLMFSFRKKLSGLFKGRCNGEAEAFKNANAEPVDRDMTDHVIDMIDDRDDIKKA